MVAARTNSLEAIDLLLQKKAEPNHVDSQKYTALSYAIMSENIEIVKKLFKITFAQLDDSLKLLSQSLIKIDKELRIILKLLITKTKALFYPFLENCSKYAKYDCFEILFIDHPDLGKGSKWKKIIIPIHQQSIHKEYE